MSGHEAVVWVTFGALLSLCCTNSDTAGCPVAFSLPESADQSCRQGLADALVLHGNCKGQCEQGHEGQSSLVTPLSFLVAAPCIKQLQQNLVRTDGLREQEIKDLISAAHKGFSAVMG